MDMPGKRAKDQKRVNMWMTEEEKKLLEETAKKHGYTSVTEFVKDVARGVIKITCWFLGGCLLLAKLTHNPTDWSGEALAQAGVTGLSWFGQGAAYILGAAWKIGGELLAAI